MKSRVHGTLWLVTLALFAGSVVAQPTGYTRMQWLDDSHTVARLDRIDAPDVQPQAIIESYDNWRSPTYGNGAFVMSGVQRVGTHEFGDDLSLVNNHAGAILDSTGSSFSNMAAYGVWTSVRVTYRWYALDAGQMLRSYSFLLLMGFTFNPGETYLSGDNDGDWRFLQVPLPTRFGFSIQYSDATGISTNDIGMAVGGPRNTGFSSSFLRDYTVGQDLNLGNDQTNLAMYIHSYSVPGPTALGLTCICSIAVNRRPRRILSR